MKTKNMRRQRINQFFLLKSIRIRSFFMARQINIGKQMKLRNLKIHRGYGEGEGGIKLSVFSQVIFLKWLVPLDQVHLKMCVR